ncbi:Calycin [Trinorchestia longiramus]|nr:Calycin [Trinorchestia longiramus]
MRVLAVSSESCYASSSLDLGRVAARHSTASSKPSLNFSHTCANLLMQAAEELQDSHWTGSILESSLHTSSGVPNLRLCDGVVQQLYRDLMKNWRSMTPRKQLGLAFELEHHLKLGHRCCIPVACPPHIISHATNVANLHATNVANLHATNVANLHATNVANLHASNFAGDWFVYQQSDNSIENLWACKMVIYSPTDDQFEYKFRVNNIDTSYVGTYTLNTAGAGVASINLRYQLALGADSFGNVNHFVLATDNTNFAILRACTNFGLFNQQYVHVLTRTRTPSANIITQINAALAAENIQTSQLSRTIHAGYTADSACYNPYTSIDSADDAYYNPYTSLDTADDACYNTYTSLDTADDACYNPYTSLDTADGAYYNPYTSLDTADGACYNPYTSVDSADDACYNPYTSLDTADDTCYNTYTSLDTADDACYNPYTSLDTADGAYYNPYTSLDTADGAYYNPYTSLDTADGACYNPYLAAGASATATFCIL